MRSVRSGSALAFFLLNSAAFAQVSSLSIINYEQVSEVPAAPNVKWTYRPVVSNSGPATSPITAMVKSLSPSLKVSGSGTLHFPSVPANGVAASNNTVSFLVPANTQVNFSELQWTFQTVAPVADPGPNLTVPVGTSVNLSGINSTNPSGVGTLTYSWSFVSIPAGSQTVLRQATSPIAWFNVDVAGTYVVKLIVSNGSASSSATVTVSTTQIPPPVANAGQNQTVPLGSPVILNGSASTSPNGLPLTYSWSIISRPSGSTAALQGSTTVSPFFVADKDGTYQVQLIVNDGVPSSPSTVTISTRAVAPVANAGTTQVVSVGATVQLNGAGSTDANGLTLTYSWSLLSVPAGSAAKLTSPAAVNPTFVADKAGAYVAQLIVNDGQLSSAPATVTITTASQLAPPTANAGQNQTVSVGALVTLNGSGTDPQNLPLSYHWTLIGKPAGSAAGLSSTTISDPTFTADLAGTYAAQLIVSDGTMSSTPATVSISTQCLQPVANAGTNQNVSVGQTVALNGGASTGACGNGLTYSWILNRPPASTASLANATSSTPSFVPDVAGVYVPQLIVNNGLANSNPATVSITASGGSTTTGGSGGAIVMPAGITISQSISVPLSVTLSTPAASSVVITIQSSDTSMVTVSPNTITIAAGATSSATTPRVTGVKAGTATLTASASGFASATESVDITTNIAPLLTFTPGSILINGTSTQSLTLWIPSPAPSQGLTVELTSDTPSVATVPASVTVPANSTSVLVPVTGVSAGNAGIIASAPGYQNTFASITVYSSEGISVTWYGACWVNTTIYGVTGNFQAIDLLLVAPQPVVLEGTLFFAPNCDASQGMDNMNDYGTLSNPGHIIHGFSFHPNVIPSSAIYWIGPQTSNGMCAPGAPCSGCVNYTKSTPYCSALP